MLLRRYDLIGIDLAVKKPSSLAGYSKGRGIEIWRMAHHELLEGELETELVVIDAPLSLPKEGAFRDFERKVLLRGYRLLPIKRGPMRELAIIGSQLKLKLESKGVKVLETHPSSALKAIGITRHQVVSLLSKMGFIPSPPKSEDDEDALICLLVGMLYLKGGVEIYEGEEGLMVLPKPGLRLRDLDLT
ncbi:MAG: hypothetical protein QI199_07420 [Candidatus Korarchaeota archaeon]|nr:hypothetical protein [Candidatus Korarchaeota archaeon]